VWALGVVSDEVSIEVGLHFFDNLVSLLAVHESNVLVEQGAVLDVLELEEQIVSVPIRPAAELAVVVARGRGGPGLVLLDGREHVSAFNAGLLYGLQTGRSLPEAGRLANAVAALVVASGHGILGAPDLTQVETFIKARS
jgi:hypothetical protein